MKTRIITNSNKDLAILIAEIENQTIENNLIVDLSKHHKLTVKDINLFLPISKSCKKGKKSFVIVVSDIDFNKVSDKLTVVPTIQEAHDLIEMEEIERDLGF